MILSTIVAKLKRRAKPDVRGRYFEAALSVQAVSWYLRYPLSYRDIEELLPRARLGGGPQHAEPLGAGLRVADREALAAVPSAALRVGSDRRDIHPGPRAVALSLPSRRQARHAGGLPAHGQARSGRRQTLLPQGFAGSAAALARSDRHGWRQHLSARDRDGEERRPPGAHPAPSRHQAPATRHRERPLPSDEEHAPDRRLPIIRYGAADHPGLRGHAVAAQGF